MVPLARSSISLTAHSICRDRLALTLCEASAAPCCACTNATGDRAQLEERFIKLDVLRERWLSIGIDSIATGVCGVVSQGELDTPAGLLRRRIENGLISFAKCSGPDGRSGNC